MKTPSPPPRISGRSLSWIVRQQVEPVVYRLLGAIADSNMTPLLAAGLLFFLATGPVLGFGVTLSIGVLAALISTRVLAEWAVNRRAARRRPQVSRIANPGRVSSRLPTVS
jgi:SecD/SecF fusion protein